MLQFWFATLLLAIYCSAPVFAQSNADANAADDYRSAIEQLEALDADTINVIANYASSDGRNITPEVSEALRRAQPIIDAFRDASRTESIDWGIDYSEGAYTLLPHLSPMRRATQLIVAESRRAIATGDSKRAADLLAAGMRITDHTSAEPVLITSLVSMAQFNLIERELQSSIDRGELSQDEARSLLDATETLTADDPFGYFESTMNEQTAMVDWLRNEFTQEGGLERFQEEDLAGLAAGDPSVGTTFKSQEEFNVAVMGLDLAMDEMLSAMQQDDLQLSMATLKRLEKDIEAGAFGPLSFFLPSMGRTLKSYLATCERLDRITDSLETIAATPEGAESLLNAAVWYWKAIEQRKLLSKEQWELVQAFVADPHQPITTEVREAVELGQPIIAVLHKATAIENCRFDLNNMWSQLGLYASFDHLPGMKDCAVLLIADAICTAEMGDNDDQQQSPALQLAEVMQMIEHLGSDKQMPSIDTMSDIGSMFVNACGRIAVEIVADANMTQLQAAISECINAEMMPFRMALFSYGTYATEWLIDNSQNNRGTFDRESYMMSHSRMRGTEQLPELLDFIESHDDATVMEAMRKSDRLVVDWQDHVREGNDPLLFEIGMGSSPQVNAESHLPLPFRDWLIEPIASAAKRWHEVQADLRDLHDGVLAD